jgi:hypothetical protein
VSRRHRAAAPLLEVEMIQTSRFAHATRSTAIACFMLFLAGTSIAAADDSTEDSPSAGLVGTWMIQVTLRDCASGAPLGPAFPSLVTFHRDGTITEDPGSVAFAPGQRSSGHGTWTHQPGHTFAQEMIALVLFTTSPNLPSVPGFDPSKPVSPGFFAGSSTVSHTIRLTGRDQVESSGTNRFYNSNGEVYRTGCSTAMGQRFE